MRKTGQIGIIFFLFAGLIIFGCKDKAPDQQQNSAKVIFSIGDVQVREAEKWVPALENMILYQGNELKTGSDSQCNILIGNNSFISVKEGSHLILSSLFKDITGMENNSVELKLGKSVINPKKLLKGEQFEVKTPTAIAAVRGTQFIVESNPQGTMKVAVMDGKVELTRRIPALEEVEKKIIDKSDVLTTLKEKVAQESIIVDANESAFIDNRKAEKENKVIKEIVTKHIEEIKMVEGLEGPFAAAADNAPAKEPEAAKALKLEKLKKNEEELKKVLSNLEIMKKEEMEVVQIKLEKKVEVQDIKDIKELETVIKDAREKQKAQAVPAPIKEEKKTAELTIISPIKQSVIYVNSRFVGHDRIVFNPEPDKKIEVKITALGYEDFIKEIKLGEGDKKEINAHMIERPRLTIVSPIKNSNIFVNSKYVGRDSVEYRPSAGENIIVTVKARGYKESKTEIVLKKKEEKTITMEMELSRAMDRLKWVKNIGPEVMVNPVYYKGTLIIATDNGDVLAMNNEGGRIWKLELKRRIEATPLVHKGVIYIITNSGDFYSVNASNGDIIWKKKIEGSLLFGSQPIIEGDSIYLATSYGKIYAVSLKGKDLWGKDIENGIYASPVISKDVLYVGAEDRNVYALSAKQGELLWTFRTDGRMVSSAPVISGKTLLVGCYSGTFFAINTLDGKLKWKYKTGDAILSSPVVKKDLIYFGSNDANIYALSVSDGKLVWKFNTGEKVLAKPEFNGPSVFITSGSSVFALDAGSGAEQWRHNFKGKVRTSAIIVGNDIFVGLDGGQLASVRNSLTRTY